MLHPSTSVTLAPNHGGGANARRRARRELDLDGPQPANSPRTGRPRRRRRERHSVADLLELPPDGVRPERFGVAEGRGRPRPRCGHPAAGLDGEPGTSRADAHTDLDVALPGEVALAQLLPTPRTSAGGGSSTRNLRSISTPRAPVWIATAGTLTALHGQRVPVEAKARTRRASLAALRPRVRRRRAGGAHARPLLDTFDGRLHHAGLRLDPPRPACSCSTGPGRDGRPGAVSRARPAFANDLPPGPFRSRLADVSTSALCSPSCPRRVDTARR